MFIAHVLFLAAAIGSAMLLGMARGRERERHILLSPVVLGTGERRIGDYEYQLRSKVGARHMHPDPDNAPRLVKMRVRR